MEISRQVKITVGAAVAAVAVVLLSTVVLHMSIERALLLAPVLVVASGIIVGLALFWGRVALHQWRGDDRQPKQ